jgi:hypothetical protein
MKRLAAVVVMVAWLAASAGAQRGGSYGGFSGSHTGSSGSHGGFSAPPAGFVGHSSPSFHGGMQASAPPRFAGPSRYTTGTTPYSTRGFRPSGPSYAGPRPPYTGSMHRMPYQSPNGGNHTGGDHNGWNHNGWDHHDGDHLDWGHDGNHHHGVFYTYYGWPAPLYPGWGWGYPYLLPSYLDYPNDYGSQPDSYTEASQPYEDNGPYEAPPPDQYVPPPSGSYTPWPYGSQPAPSGEEPTSPPVPESPVTLVFKDGRPPQQIHNYLLTATTLSVLDQRRQDIPVDQIDLAATARVNRDAGVSFALPGGSR